MIDIITYRKAKQLVSVGDCVYTTNGNKIVPAVVLKIKQDHIETDLDFFFDEHGFAWWLTEKVAIENGGRKNERN